MIKAPKTFDDVKAGVSLRRRLKYIDFLRASNPLGFVFAGLVFSYLLSYAVDSLKITEEARDSISHWCFPAALMFSLMLALIDHMQKTVDILTDEIERLKSSVGEIDR